MLLVSTAFANWKLDNFQYTPERQLTVLQMSYVGFGIDVEVRNFPYTKGVEDVTSAFMAKIHDRAARGEVRYVTAEVHGPLTYHKYVSTDNGQMYGNITVIYSLANNDVTIVHFRVKVAQEMQIDWREFTTFVQKNWNTVLHAFEQQTIQSFAQKLAPAVQAVPHKAP